MEDSNPSDTISAVDALNQVWGSPNITDAQAEERAFKDVIILNDGRKMSFTNDTQECFGQYGQYFEFSFD